MSKENLKFFNEKVGSDVSLQEKLKTINEKYGGKFPEGKELDAIYENEIIPLAKEHGFDFTLAEVKEYLEEIAEPKPDPDPLTDEELDAVSGGGMCICVVAGGGGDKYGCSCVLWGIAYTDSGSKCICVIGGGG